MVARPVPDDVRRRLAGAGLDVATVVALADSALAEDLDGGQDVTSVATVSVDTPAQARFVARAEGVLAGCDVARVVMARAGTGSVSTQAVTDDGARVRPGDTLMLARGTARDLLLGERTALNLLCHLSGVATATRAWVDAVAGTGAAVRDTRKTTPLLRALEKYAVRCGGGVNHRMSLADAALVKDNHVVAAGGVVAAFERVRAQFPEIPVEVEVDSVADAVAAVDAGADLVLLDNFDVDALRQAVELVSGRARLEASGGLTLERAAQVAATGVDYLAVGALTHSAPALDIALDFDDAGVADAARH
jgi:nicotinate-nucleotide pyrophosphorylase (carboxylating)